MHRLCGIRAGEREPAQTPLAKLLIGSEPRWLIGLLCLTVGLVTMVMGLGLPLERGLQSAFMLARTTPASGQVVIIEVDARSLAQLNHWPWPRTLYARAIDRLHAAGARTIAFDIDFSAHQSPKADALFASALRAAGGAVILPTFRQRAGENSSEWIESQPIDILREVSFLSAVNVFPDEDGQVRRYPLGVSTGGVPRPSIGAMLADVRAGANRSFPVDYGINPETIPRVSFVDLVNGRVPVSSLRGRRVLVGATAIELGDRYAVPGHGIIPGVVIQALAAETLLAHGIPGNLGSGPALAIAFLSILVVSCARSASVRKIAIGLAPLAMIVLALCGQMVACTVELVPGLAALSFLILGELILAVRRDLARRRYVDLASGLPNLSALVEFGRGQCQLILKVARVDRSEEVIAALGPEHAVTLIRGFEERLRLATGQQLFRVEEGSLGWLEPAADREDEFDTLAAMLRAPIRCGGTLVDLRPTFGVAEGTGNRTSSLIAGALVAARRAKEAGGRWDRFVTGDSDETKWELSLLGGLDEAIASGQLWVAYQPKYGVRPGRIVGAEALVRWQHPDRGALPPDSFIPLIEREGRTLELTQFVLDRALSDLAIWRSAGHDLGVAVNLSATLLAEPTLIGFIAEALRRHGVSGDHLTLELTESAVVANAEIAVSRFAEIGALGINLSIDDYGTGQSTLTYLRKVPANELKIDKSFVQGMLANSNDHLLIRSTIELAHALHMRVVAEGVEDAAVFDALRDLECDIIQGWHTGRPVDAQRFLAELANISTKAA